jgi:hypothetical protein
MSTFQVPTKMGKCPHRGQICPFYGHFAHRSGQNDHFVATSKTTLKDGLAPLNSYILPQTFSKQKMSPKHHHFRSA